MAERTPKIPFYTEGQRYFPEEVYKEARDLVAGIDSSHFDGRRVVSGTAIDEQSTVKRSDVLDVRRETHGYAVSVSVPDVASVIPPESLTDREARLRVKSRYVAEKAFMLPGIIGEETLNFREGHSTPALTITVRTDSGGILQNCLVEETVVENPRCISYQEADSCIASNENLGELYTLAQILLTRRLVAGALSAVDLDGFNEHLGRGGSFKMVRECMLLVNAAIADWLRSLGEPAMYLNCRKKTDSPDVDEISRTMREGLKNKHALQLLIHTQFPIWFDELEFAARPTGHDQLQLPAYLHVTSPLSIYSDLVIQRIIKSILRGGKRPYTEEELAALCENENKFTRYIKRRNHIVPHALQKSKAGSSAPKDITSIDITEFKQITPNIQLEILRRLQSPKLKQRTLCFLLMKAEKGHPLWDPVIQKVFEILRLGNHHTTGIFSRVAAQFPEIFGSFPVFEGERKDGIWTVRCVVKLHSRFVSSSSFFSNANIRAAKREAAIAWWEAFVEKTLVPCDVPTDLKL